MLVKHLPQGQEADRGRQDQRGDVAPLLPGTPEKKEEIVGDRHFLLHSLPVRRLLSGAVICGRAQI